MNQTPLELAREKRKELAESGELERLSWAEKAKRNVKSRVLAIHAMCEQCMGGAKEPGIRAAIKECSSWDCPLHHFRPYKP